MANLIELAEVQRKLHLSRTKVWQLRKSGELPTVFIGRRKFVPETALNAYIESLFKIKEH